MKNALLATVLMAVALPVGAQVGVSINVGEPGFYGQINIGNAPAPQLIYPQPVVIVPAPRYVGVPPIYLRVARATRASRALAQLLCAVQRLRTSGLFRAQRLVSQPVCAILPRTAWPSSRVSRA